MIKYIGITLLLLASVTGIARAEYPETEGNKGMMGGWFNDVRDARTEKREEITDMRVERKDMMEGNKEELEAGREAIKNASPEDRPALLEAQKEKREAFRGEFKEKTKEIIEARVHFAANLYQMVIVRLEQIADRLDSRIEKLTAEGKDMTNAESAVDEARKHIANAKTAAEEITVVLESLTDKSGFFEENKEKIAEIRSELKLAHQSLKKAVEAIKAVMPKVEGETQ
jgi:chromosome segregation ATPase